MDTLSRTKASPSPARALRKRRAFRIPLIYGTGVFLLLEAADALVPALGLPSGINRVLALLFVGGLPIAVTVGWALDWRAARGSVGTGEDSPVRAEPDEGVFVPTGPGDPPEVGGDETVGRGHRGGPILIVGLASTTVSISLVLAFLGWSRLGLETYVALWATVAGGIWFLFDKTEQTVPESVRAQTVHWLTAGSVRDVMDEVPKVFQVVFDKVFGERHLTWTCFYRSCFASLLAVGLVLIGWFATRPEARALAGEPAFIRSVLWLVFFTGLLNFIPDYLSLLETRFVLKRWAGRWRTRTLLLSDAVFTAAISFLVISFSMSLVYGSGVILYVGDEDAASSMTVDVRSVALGSAWDQFVDMATFQEEYGEIALSVRASDDVVSGEVPIPVGVFFYSAFITSAWLWLFALATLVLRWISFVGEKFRPLAEAMGYRETPFRAVGYASILVVTAVFLTGLPLVVL